MLKCVPTLQTLARNMNSVSRTDIFIFLLSLSLKCINQKERKNLK